MTTKYDLRMSEDSFKQNFRNLLEDLEDAVLLSGGETGEQDVTGDLSITGSLGVGTTSPGMAIGIEKTQDTAIGLRMQNLSGGTLASANTDIRSDTARLIVAALSSARALSVYGQAMANWTELRTLAGGGLSIGTGTLNAPVLFGTNGTLRLKIEGDGRVCLFQTLRSTALFSKTADTTLAAVTGLAFTVPPGSYRFEADLQIDAPAAGGYKLAVGGTATTTSYISWLSGTAVVSVAGTLAPLFAQNAAAGAASTVAIGSSFQIWPI
jgi:hypothetical protein